MLSFLKPTPEEIKRAAIIERKRMIEEKRKSRIFDPHVRRIGIDKEFLDKQVEEKKRSREIQAQRETLMDEALIRNSKIAMMIEKKEEEKKKKIEKEINDFRRFCQLPQKMEDSEIPIDTQTFEGEDENLEKRLKIQKQQTRDWITRQIEERRDAENARRDAEKAFQEAITARDKRAIALQKMELFCRRKMNAATAEFNLALAAEQDYRRKCEALLEEEDKKVDIYNQMSGDFLTESRDQAESIRGPGRPIQSCYKGMTKEELKIIYDEQLRQIQEIQKLKEEEKRRNEIWDLFMATNARVSESYQREIERKKAQLNKEIAEKNAKLAREQKCHQQYLNSVLYQNKADADFYKQFNKSTR